MTISFILGTLFFIIIMIFIFVGIAYVSGKSKGSQNVINETKNESIKQAQEIIKSNESSYTDSVNTVDQQLREFERKDN
jgi:uncharacterized membrane protein